MASSNTATDRGDPNPLGLLLRHLQRVRQGNQRLPDANTPAGTVTREFLENNFIQAREHLLSRTTRMRVWPWEEPYPAVFDFEFDLPYKRRPHRDGPVELAEGPIRGQIHYRTNLFVEPEGLVVAVALDPGQAFYHPNYSPKFGLVCLGEMTGFGEVTALETLLLHLWTILSYQNRRPSHPADFSAARYFALEPEAMQGLEPVEPLY